MAFQSVPETAEAVVRGLVGSVIVTNTHYFRLTGGYSSDDLQDLADAVDLWFSTEVLPFLSAQCDYINTVVRGLENQNDLTAEADAGTGGGDIVADLLPNNVSLAIKRFSSFTGRSARGRVYIFGIPDNALAGDENFVDSTFQDNMNNAFNDQATYLDGLGWVPVIVSRYNNGAQRDEGTTFAIQGWELNDRRIDSRRDRLP